MKEFFYNVNGSEFYDTVAFGKAWEQAKAKATAEHCPIFRTVVQGEKISEEYFAGGWFLRVSEDMAEHIKIF